jgi:hypothetical protein
VRYEASASIIAEGPNNWRLRPVAEVLGARDFGESGLYGGVAGSVLVGGILRATDALSFDLAGRYGRAGGRAHHAFAETRLKSLVNHMTAALEVRRQTGVNKTRRDRAHARPRAATIAGRPRDAQTPTKPNPA